MTDPSPRRVRIVSPRSRAARTSGRRPVSHDIGEGTTIGEVYMASLVRTQLRLAVGVLLIFAVLLGGLPLLMVLEPGMAEVHVLGVPLPWVLLGVLVHPTLLAGAYLYVRQAERNEHDFADLVERS